MSETYTYVANLAAEITVPENGILSRTIQDDERTKVVAFGFSKGHELSAHTAPMPAVIYMISGSASLTLGEDTHEVGAGAVIHMPPLLVHGIRANEPMVMLLVLVKNPAK